MRSLLLINILGSLSKDPYFEHLHSSLFGSLFGNIESQNEKMMLQQLFISLFILSNCYSKKIVSSPAPFLNKKIVSSLAPFFNLSFFSFSHFHNRLSLSSLFPFSFLLFSPTLSPLLKLRSWPGVECQSQPGWSADLGLGWSSIWVS